jgi:hypothetical protein
MAWAKGQSGNTNGRPVGSVNKSTALRKALSDNDIQDLLQVVYRQAMDGDTTSQKLILERLIPVAKSESKPLPPGLSLSGNVEADLERINAAMAQGTLSIEQATQLVQLAGRVAEIGIVPALQARLDDMSQEG